MTLNEFKTRIKSRYPDHRPCRLSKTFKAQLGFNLKHIDTSCYGRTRLSTCTCHHSIFTVWWNYVALVSFVVVTIIVIYYIYIHLIYLFCNLHLFLYLPFYFCIWSYLLLLLLLLFIIIIIIIITIIIIIIIIIWHWL